MDRALGRLLRCAARARREGPEEAPFGLASRALAGSRRQRPGDLSSVVRLARRGLVWASVLMALALALNYYHSQNSGAEADLSAPAWAIISPDP
jgi:hypothetical protein